MLKKIALFPVFISLVACGNAIVGCSGSSPELPGGSGGDGAVGTGGTGSGGSAAGSGGGSGVGSGGAAAAGGNSGVGGGGDGSSGGGDNASGGASGEMEWLPSWATTIQSLEANKADHVPPTLPNNTVRQFIWPTVSGGQVRIQLSNEKGTTPVDIQKVHIARSKSSDSLTNNGQIDTSTDTALTFGGVANVTIPAGMTVWSDGVDFALEELKFTAVTIQFGASVPSNVTNHPGSRTTSYFTSGDAVAAESLSSPETRDRWYFINALEVMAPSEASAIAVLGDSITDGYGITVNKFVRWTDFLTLAIQEDPAIADTRSVLNFGMGANTLASSSTYQDSGLIRFGRDVLTRNKVKYLIVLEGVNDITNTGTAQNVTDAYQDIIEQATAKGIKVFVSPLTPMNAETNSKRAEVNTWVRASSAYNAGVDFDKAIADPSNPDNTQAAFKNDDLHPSEAGYQAIAQSVDLGLFH